MNSIKIATWNVQRPPRRVEGRTQRIQTKLESVAADIWVLTESRTSLAPADAFYSTHSGVHAGRLPTDDLRWVSIWSHWPASVLAEDHWSATALIDTPMGELIVQGVVLPYMHEPAPGLADVWSRFSHELANQRDSWAGTRAKHADIPMVVAGDLNQTIGGSLRYGSPDTRKLLLEALAAADLKCLTAGDEPTGTLRNVHLVDHICATSNLTAGMITYWEPKDLDGQTMSDHRGVAIELTRSQQG